MRKAVISFLSVVIISISFPISAAVVSGDTEVLEIYTYAEAGQGDSIFHIKDTVAGCDGFWISASSPGAKNLLAGLLSAYQTKSPVIVYADEYKTFSGSSKSFCKVTVLRLRPLN